MQVVHVQLETVFDVTDAGFKNWRLSAGALIPASAALTIMALQERGVMASSSFLGFLGPYRQRKWPARLILGFSILWALTTFVVTFSDYRRAVNAMRNGSAKIVEGTVTRFAPMPHTGHSMESFGVNGLEFEYSDFFATAGFNNTATYGGPIREGLFVKIWHLGGEILRLDVEKAPNQTSDPTLASGTPAAGQQSRHP
jgi:hypothetical protein